MEEIEYNELQQENEEISMVAEENIIEKEVQEEPEDFMPFEPEKISIEQKTLSLDTILRRISQNMIILTPDFQREEVWTDLKRSQLIESLLLRIPIPMFYLSSDDKGILSVVDGLQRMSTIRDFVLGKDYLNSGDENSKRNEKLLGHGFKLKNLEFCSEYEGYQFCDLPPVMQNRIFETNFQFTIINPGTPEEVKRNIFKRINTGGMQLTDQEMRNAMYIGQATDLLKRLVDDDIFQRATGNSLKYAKRSEDAELALRLVAFVIRDFTGYDRTVSTDQWLSDTMIILNSLPNLNCKEYIKFQKSRRSSNPRVVNDMTIYDIEYLFYEAMDRCYQLFGRHAFRKSHGKMKRSPINRCLFEMWGYILGHITQEQFESLLSMKYSFQEQYFKLLDDYEFLRSITTDSMKHTAVKYRFNALIDLVKPFI